MNYIERKNPTVFQCDILITSDTTTRLSISQSQLLYLLVLLGEVDCVLQYGGCDREWRRRII